MTSGRTTRAAQSAAQLYALGDAAVLIEFSRTLDLAVNARLQELAGQIRSRGIPWVRDIVPALGSLVVHFDLAALPGDVDPVASIGTIVDAPRPRVTVSARQVSGRVVELPVCYAPEFGIDLDEIAGALGLSGDEIVRRHTAGTHTVLMMGFAPGQPYVGGLDPSLSLPRRATPRTAVPAGTIAIANTQTAVYPFSISGGWNIIGRTPLRVFDVDRDPPALFSPGDTVRFVAISTAEFNGLLEQR